MQRTRAQNLKMRIEPFEFQLLIKNLLKSILIFAVGGALCLLVIKCDYEESFNDRKNNHAK